MKIIGSSRPVADQGEEGCGLEATEQYDNGTCFCVYNGYVRTGMKFILFPVSDTETEDMKKQLIPLRKKRSPPPNADLSHFGSSQLTYGTSFVSVGSMLYFIGGLKEVESTGSEYGNDFSIRGRKGDKNTAFVYGHEVRKFDTKISEFEQADQGPPPLNEARCFPAVVAIGNIIYVFDGLSPTATEHSSWAECLNTDMPIAMQKWMPLKQPPFTLGLTNCPFAIPYGNDSILIADKEISSEGALLYNVGDGSWMKYEPSFGSYGVWAPVSVVCEKTIYWIGKLCIYAYDYEKHVQYSGLLREILYEKDFVNDLPYLMHLKDDIFCCFTLYAVYDHRGLSKTEVVQCTTFQVTKISSGYGHRNLRLRAIGYKSYNCGKVFSLHGVVSIQTRICLPETKKPRSGAKKKKCLKEKKMAQSHLAVPA